MRKLSCAKKFFLWGLFLFSTSVPSTSAIECAPKGERERERENGIELGDRDGGNHIG